MLVDVLSLVTSRLFVSDVCITRVTEYYNDNFNLVISDVNISDLNPYVDLQIPIRLHLRHIVRSQISFFTL